MSEAMAQEKRAGAPAEAPGPYMQIAMVHPLDKFSLRISCELSARWTVLFGPSGAGKTSLLRVLAGLTKPASGRLVLHGRTLLERSQGIFVAPSHRGIGYVTQRPTLFPHMNITANVSFGLAGMTRVAAAARVEELLALVEASHLATRSPRDLSGGEKQRVALARSLATEPRMLLLDEPFTGMDADLKEAVLEKLTAWLAERNVPALYVSHDVAEAFRTQAEVIIMQKGEIQAQGPAQIVLAERRQQLLRQLGGSGL